MSTLKRIIYLTKDQKEELLANKTITVNGKTVEYDKDDLYIVDVDASIENVINKDLTIDQKKQALLNLDGIRIVTLHEGSITLEEIANMITEINRNGEHVFFDTAALAYPLYLCTIAINYENNTPVSYRLSDLVSGNISIGAYDGEKTLAQVLAGAVNAFYTLTVAAVTQDDVTVTGQIVTLRSGSANGPIYATASYNGQPVSFSVPNGLSYYVSISSALQGHFNPTTANGIISGANVFVTLTYSDFHTIRRFTDVQAALNDDIDLTDFVGQQVYWMKNNTAYYWDVYNYDEVNKVVWLLYHGTLPDQMQFEPPQALAWFEEGLTAGAYSFKRGNANYYFTLTTDIPAGGQLRATTTSFTTYASQNDTAMLEAGSVDTTKIAGAINLGTTGTDTGLYPLNHQDRVDYGSNNFLESGLLQWMNSTDPANTPMPRLNKFSRPYIISTKGLLADVAAEDLACIDEATWKCSANTVYEAPASMGGTTVKNMPYTVTAKIALASEKEIFGSYSGVDAGDSIADLYANEEITNTDRIKYYNNSARPWWLRSPHSSNSYHVRSVASSGDSATSGAAGRPGVVPACQIRKQS